MRGARNGRRWLSWLGVVAVLSNVLAGALCHMVTPVQAGVAVVDDVLGALEICTTHGIQAPQSADSNSSSPDRKQSYCAICTLLAGFALVVALAVSSVTFSPKVVLHRLVPSARTLADHLRLGGIRSRAPPAFA